MNVKIQGGGGGSYSNKGSCFGAANYLNHENDQRMKDGLKNEPFFNYEGGRTSFADMINDIDRNKAQLGKDQSKFFVITVSPSEKEQLAMGKDAAERSLNFKYYVRDQIMEQYAQNFNKGLSARDLKWYAKIHHGRGDKAGEQMHAHIIVSRKDMQNKIKLSPMTTHRTAKNSGRVQSGFDRTNFFEKCEKTFDQTFKHERDFSESFEYCNAIKHGTFQEKTAAIHKLNKINLAKDLLKVTLNPTKAPILVAEKLLSQTQKKDRGLSL